MVPLPQVVASNAQIPGRLPPRPIAIFVGATSGIGEYTLKAFAKHTTQPRIYFIGRSQEAGERIKTECQSLNASGEFIFIKSDIGLLKNVDDVCKQIRDKEDKINLLVLSQGTLVFDTETGEGLHTAAALVHHSRLRFILNLLPFIQKAEGLRRVVSIFAGTQEGNINLSNLQASNVWPFTYLQHMATLVTLTLETVAKQASDVGFIHDFPGSVPSGIGRDTGWSIMGIAKMISKVLEPLMGINVTESGERHLFLATSARYAGKLSGMDGVPLLEGMNRAKGTNGSEGSGIYTVDQYGNSAGDKVVNLLKRLRAEGVPEKAWEMTMEDFRRITGSESM